MTKPTLGAAVVALGLGLGVTACLAQGAGGAAAGFEVGQGGRIALPSGRVVQFHEVVGNAPGTEGATARFRFIAAQLRQDEDWSEDMLSLCENYALSRVEAMVPPPRQIVISLADRELPFGEAAPEAVQFFEAYDPQDGHCIWEMF